MREPRAAEVGEFVAAAAVRAFGERDVNVRLLEPIDDRRAGECSPTLPAQRVRHAGDDVKGFHFFPSHWRLRSSTAPAIIAS